MSAASAAASEKLRDLGRLKPAWVVEEEHRAAWNGSPQSAEEIEPFARLKENKAEVVQSLQLTIENHEEEIAILKSKVEALKKQNKQLKKISERFNLAAIKMEVGRGSLPDKVFLQKVRKICNKKKIILIFDECTSGFRECLGGKHLDYGVNPDLAMFGKAMGNGMPIGSISGKSEFLMEFPREFLALG